ncbi:MAG: hypothetical protein JXB05_26595 [Myxococcaceae bacterium]|nr:hypothetical protein [Myxococcaceae bacterium]
MIRPLVVFTGALLLLAGCEKNESEVRKDCELEKLDLSSCDRSGLGAIQADGIWNMELTFSDGERTPGVTRYIGTAEISGLPISEKRVEPELFLLTSETQVETSVGPLPRKYLFAGCRSSSPTQVEGQFRRCTNGTLDLEGTFQSTRIVRRAGEAESSGVQLVSETALPRSDPQEVAPTNGVPVDVFVAGGYAYISALEEGLYIYDISNPAAPRRALQLKPSEGDAWHQAVVRDQTLYLASTKRGVLLYDVSNPEAPLSLKSFPAEAVDVRALAFDGSWLYAASPQPNAEVIVFDATHARELTVAKRYFVEQSNPGVGDRPYDVLAQNGRLYVSHWSYGLAVSDVTDPTKPKLLGRYVYDNATTRTAAVGTFGSRTLAFEAGEFWGASLRVLDVTAADNITQVAQFKLRPEISIRALALSGTKLYLAHYQDGLRVLDVSNPNEPLQTGYYNTWRETDSYRGGSFYEGLSDVSVAGDGYIYTTETSRGLLIFREQP